nr:RpoZ [Tsunamia transpacifica]
MNKSELIASSIILAKTEQLLKVATNRYKITIQVAHRAKRRRYEDVDIIDDPKVKPVIRAVLEMVDGAICF